MSKWILVGAPCLVSLVLLATGALPRQPRNSPAAAPDAFVAQAPPLAQPDLDGTRLLERLLGTLRPMRWLKTTIWQRLHDPEGGYESETNLVLGPDHCARMETTVTAGAASCRLLVVSDGRVLAEVIRRRGKPDTVVSSYLPDGTVPAARDQFLRKHGCVGPAALVAGLRTTVPVWQVQAGCWRDRAVLRLSGAFDPKRSKDADQATAAAHSCRLYLDPATLWPLRLEWWDDSDPGRARLCLEMEYRDAELDRALTPAECAHAFTYQPER